MSDPIRLMSMSEALAEANRLRNQRRDQLYGRFPVRLRTGSRGFPLCPKCGYELLNAKSFPCTSCQHDPWSVLPCGGVDGDGPIPEPR